MIFNHIDGELGIAVQAGTIHGGVHFHAVPRVRTKPRQLPRGPERLIDRADVLATLNGSAADATIVISGSGGVGKTALALAWLHRVADRYPAGQLFADLRGAVSPAEVLEEWLRALGVAPEQIPAGLRERAALFRSLTTGRRLAVLADGAASTAQVRPLIPGPGSLMVITTRHRLTGLVARGARTVPLSPLDEISCLNLLGGVITPERVRAEPEVAHALIVSCGRNPLAVCLAGAILATHPRWPIARLVRNLPTYTTEEMTEIFDAAYRALPSDEARRLYRLLPAHRGPDITAGAAAALAGTTIEEATGYLEQLAEAHLLTEHHEGRYAFHDLALEHARATGREHGSGDEAAAFARLAYWYLRTAAAAQRTLIPGRWYLGQVFTEPPVAELEDAAALAWLETERHNLLATARTAHETGLHTVAWQIVEAMWGLFVRRRHYGMWVDAHEVGSMAAQAAGDPQAQARMLEGQASAFLGLKHYGRAATCASQALDLARLVGHRPAEATALEQLGLCTLGRGEPHAAKQYFTAARQIHEQLGRDRGAALNRRHEGEAALDAGDYGQAITDLEAVERWCATRPEEAYLHSRCLGRLGRAYRLTGRLGEAATALNRALELSRTAQAPQQEAEVLVELADLAVDQGEPRLERDRLRAALALYEQIDAPEAATISARLASMGQV